MQMSAMKVYFQIAECSFSSAKKMQMSAMKFAYRLLSAAIFLQRYAFLLKDARFLGKMFEGEGDKKKKVYPRLPEIWGKKDTPYYIIVL